MQNNYINNPTEQSNNLTLTFHLGFDNRQSLAIQHKTIEKKSSLNPGPKKEDKMNKYLQQKKEELMASVYNKASGNNKKGFLLANYKIQKNNGRMQQMTQEVYERMHLPTEEDDRAELANENFQINNFMTETDVTDDVYAILQDKTNATKTLPPQYTQGNRMSVKIKAKNF
jgi:hypothetical protein